MKLPMLLSCQVKLAGRQYCPDGDNYINEMQFYLIKYYVQTLQMYIFIYCLFLLSKN